MFQVTYVALQINHLNACFRTTHLGPGRVPPPFWQRPGLNHLCDMFFKLQQRNKIKMSVPPAYPFIEESILAEYQQCDNKKKIPRKTNINGNKQALQFIHHRRKLKLELSGGSVFLVFFCVCEFKLLCDTRPAHKHKQTCQSRV